MTATQAKNLVGDLLQAGASVRIETATPGNFIVWAEPPTGIEVTAGQVAAMATQYSLAAIVPSARFQ